MQNNTDWWKAFEAKRAEVKRLKDELRRVREDRDEYRDRYEVQSDNLAQAMDSIAQSDRMAVDALELARDVNWFVRMQGSEDAGMQHTIRKAKEFIAKYEEPEE